IRHWISIILPRGFAPQSRLRGGCCQVTHRRVRRYRQQVTLTQRCKPTTKPIRTPHLVFTGKAYIKRADIERSDFWISCSPRRETLTVSLKRHEGVHLTPCACTTRTNAPVSPLLVHADAGEAQVRSSPAMTSTPCLSWENPLLKQ